MSQPCNPDPPGGCVGCLVILVLVSALGFATYEVVALVWRLMR